MARYCFNLGISLKRVEVIGDDEDEIVEATRRMSDKYDFVVTRQEHQRSCCQEFADRL